MLADALLRSLAGTSAKLRVTSTNVTSGQSELGLATTAFADVTVAPAVMRKLRPDLQEGGKAQWELLISATGVAQLVNALQLGSAKSLFDLTLAVTVGEQRYLIEAFTSNEAFGQVYLYRMLLSEAKQQSL
jgi:hypothetical protein